MVCKLDQTPLLNKYRGDVTYPSQLPIIPISDSVAILGIIGSFEGYTTSPLYLYNKGVWSNLQTTGLTTTIGEGLNIAKDYIRIGYSMKTTPTPMCRLNQTVNLSNHNYIKASLAANGYAYGEKSVVGISQSADVTSLSGLTSYASYSSMDTGTASLNISSITGNYYIYLAYNGYAGDHSTTYGRCFSIFLSTT